MVEAAGTKVLAQTVGQTLVLAEHDALDHAPAHAGDARDGGAGKPRVQPVADAGEPAAPSDDAPALRPQHCVDPMPTEPGALVEAVREAARGPEHPDQRKAGSLRRCAAERQLEQHRLARA